MMEIAFLGGIALAGVIVLALIGFTLARLYTRASEEKAFVRTGLGGRKVIMSGGAVVLPIFHEIIQVNRNTLRLTVNRSGAHSLITRDRLRVDVSAEFYVRVAATPEAITVAAQTLGARTNSPSELEDLVEGKFVDALRSAAATMTMQELHEMRADFVQNVKQTVTEDLAKNGLELESVSLTGLDQTKREFFDPNNAFDAEGLLKLTQEIETRNKARNDVEQDTRVAIAEKNLSATQMQLTLSRKQQEAELDQQREIANMTAQQAAEVASVEAEGRRKAEEAQISAAQEIAQRQIVKERAVAEAEAARKQAVETANLNAKTSVMLRNQELNIEVANKSEAEAAAAAKAAAAKAIAVAAEEQIETARAVEAAKRQQQVTLVRAEEVARESSMAVIIAAEAEKTASNDRAEAAVRAAQGERDAMVLRAEAINAEGQATAAALRLNNEAENALSAELIAQKIKLALIAALPSIIEKSVEPLKNIDSIKIAQVGGLMGSGNGGAVGAVGAAGVDCGTQGLPGQLVDSALRYRVAQPLVDGLMKEVGLTAGAGSIDGLMAGLKDMVATEVQGAVHDATQAVPSPSPAPSTQSSDDYSM